MTIEETKIHLEKMANDVEYKENHFREVREEEIQRIINYLNDVDKFIKAEDIPRFTVIDEKRWVDFFIPTLIEKGAISQNELEDSVWYYGSSGGSEFARWNEENGNFDQLIIKYGYAWNVCNHFENSKGFVAFVPIREATQKEIDYQETIIANLHILGKKKRTLEEQQAVNEELLKQSKASTNKNIQLENNDLEILANSEE